MPLSAARPLRSTRARIECASLERRCMTTAGRVQRAHEHRAHCWDFTSEGAALRAHLVSSGRGTSPGLRARPVQLRRRMRKLSCRMSDTACMNIRSDNSITSATPLRPISWSTPHNWCDRRCERCPIAPECPVHLACSRRRAEHRARGEDPDSSEVVAEDVRQSLESAVRMLEQLAREAGIDMQQPLPQPPVPLDAVRVQRAGRRVLRALVEWRVPVDLASEALAEAAQESIALWSILVVKAARVFSYSVEFDPETWAMDAEPNLLLMQHVRSSFSRALEELQRGLPQGSIPDEVRDGVSAFDRLLSPLFDGVSRAARRRLEVLMTHGVAPSPFCTQEDAQSRANGLED